MTTQYIVNTDTGCPIPVEVMRFPSGEVAVKLQVKDGQQFNIKNHISVLVQGYEPDTLFIIANIKDALDEALHQSGLSGKIQVRLFLSFMPHARYDRHMVDGDGFALRVFCDMLNLMKFDQILVVDPHSDATTSLLRNCRAVSQDEIWYEVLRMNIVGEYTDGTGYDVLVAPDAGAYKKIFKLAQKLKLPVVCLTKVRDLETGNIIGTALVDTLPEDAKCLIVDDLCDGGRTFLGAAKTLREHGAKQVDLAVTHGIFSQGTRVLLDGGIDHVYSTDSFGHLDRRDVDERVFIHNFF